MPECVHDVRILIALPRQGKHTAESLLFLLFVNAVWVSFSCLLDRTTTLEDLAASG